VCCGLLSQCRRLDDLIAGVREYPGCMGGSMVDLSTWLILFNQSIVRQSMMFVVQKYLLVLPNCTYNFIFVVVMIPRNNLDTI
jgi:hypothetical protein